jgi:hypothetical protein
MLACVSTTEEVVDCELRSSWNLSPQFDCVRQASGDVGDDTTFSKLCRKEIVVSESLEVSKGAVCRELTSHRSISESRGDSDTEWSDPDRHRGGLYTQVYFGS